MSDIRISFVEEPILLDVHEGAPGKDGEDGQDGEAATIRVGTVQTVGAGQPAAVRNSGTETAAVFDFDLPKGDTGNAISVADGVAKVQRLGGQTGDFELIESVTLDADAASFVRTEEPDGTPYAFKCLLVLVTFQPRSTSSDYFVFCGSSVNDRVCYLPSISAVNYAAVMMEIRGGRLFVTAMNSPYKGNNSSSYLTPNANGWIAKDAVDYIRIQNTSYDLMAGTVIEIYGVR